MSAQPGLATADRSGSRAACAAILVLAALAGCSPGEEEHESPARIDNPIAETELASVTLTPEAEERIGIRSAAITRQPVRRTRALGGEMVVPAGRAITVSAPVSGSVISPSGSGVPSAGSSVRAGQIVMRLVALPTEDNLLRVREAVGVADARLTNAEAKAQRARRLLGDSIITVAEYEDAEAEVLSARAEARSAHARLELLSGRADAVGDASELSPLAVEAPTSGLIQSMLVGVGQVVAAGTPLFEVVSTDPLWARVPVYVGDIETIDRSAPASVGSLSAASGSELRAAVPVQAPPSASPAAASADLFYAVSNSDGSLRPGQKVSVTLSLRASDDALVVPWSAVVHDIYGGTWVYERVADHRYARRRVEVSNVSDSLAALTRGPREGAPIVTVGAMELYSTEFGTGK